MGAMTKAIGSVGTKEREGVRARAPLASAEAREASKARTTTETIVEWLPLIVLPVAAMAMKTRLARWEFMWLLAGAIYFGCKWETWFRARAERARFLEGERRRPRPSGREWAGATAKTACGILLVVLIALRAPGTNGLFAGWIGMIGLVIALHFGAFHLLALAWQRAGINAAPIMRSPARAGSLSEFWGRRWNMGFKQLSHRLVYEPVRARWGSGAAVMAAFAASGIVHDAVISIPAGRGYGLPTAYFLLQGAGVLFERSAAGAWLGIRSGIRGWLFALVCAAAPAYWLFHPAFVTRVMLPFFESIGAWIGAMLGGLAL
jgi:hypothetical protein